MNAQKLYALANSARSELKQADPKKWLVDQETPAIDALSPLMMKAHVSMATLLNMLSSPGDAQLFINKYFPMNYLISLSGGVASAVATERAIERYGDVKLWFADTHWEDEDLYRFLSDLERRWGIPIERYSDGRTPLEVAEDEQIIPNQRHAPCSRSLKIRPFRKLLLDYPKPVTVLLGLGWNEQHRMDAPRKNYETIEGVTVDYPLMWKPLEYRPYTEVVKSWGIEPPRLYQYGFSHNNCGGRCVKQGIKEWLRLRQHFPERFAEVRDWEQAQRAKGGPRATYGIIRDQSNSMVRSVTLAELEKQQGLTDDTPSTDDMFGCLCEY